MEENNKKFENQDIKENFENQESALSKTEQFIDKNKKALHTLLPD